MSKIAKILSKILSNQHQLFIKGKSPHKAWNILQKRFQHTNLRSTSQIIYKATIKKLSDFKNIYKYISHYQAAFNKIISLLTKTSFYT